MCADRQSEQLHIGRKDSFLFADLQCFNHYFNIYIYIFYIDIIFYINIYIFLYIYLIYFF